MSRDSVEQLAGARLLIVEDDLLILGALASLLSDAGATIVAKCRTVKHALSVAESEPLSAALLDVQVGEDDIDPVARLLSQRGIPFVFFTGQSDPRRLRTQWPESSVLAKPALPDAIVSALAAVVAASSTIQRGRVAKPG
jgi:CheY-like chemotaxis protein